MLFIHFLKLYLFIFGYVGSLLLHRLFSSCGEQGLLSPVLVSWGAQASHCGDFFCCEALALGHMDFSSCSTLALEHRLNSCGAWG